MTDDFCFESPIKKPDHFRLVNTLDSQNWEFFRIVYCGNTVVLFLGFSIVSRDVRVILWVLSDRLTREKKKQFCEFPTAVKGIVCTRLIYLRLKTSYFWAT